MDLALIRKQVCLLAQEVGKFQVEELKSFDRNKIVSKGYNDPVSYVDQESEKMLVEGLTKIYREIMMKILFNPRRRKRVLLVIVIFTVFSYLLFPLGYVKGEFFPKSDSDRIIVSLELPLGTSKKVSETEALSLVPKILENED